MALQDSCMKSWLGFAAVVCGLLGGSAKADQVYLIQASGWMLPFYDDPASKLFSTTENLIKITQAPGWPITIASFNHDGDEQGGCSPKVFFPTETDPCQKLAASAVWSADKTAAALRAISVPKKTSGFYADTDLF